MKISIVILNWNGAEYLQQFLPKLIEHTQIPDVEIVVADNASSDGSLQVLAVDFPMVKVIALEKNFGFAEGYNKALSQLEAEYFLLLNSDVEVSENWLQPLLDCMRENPKVAVCQPKIRSFHAREYFEYAGASGGFIDTFGYPFCRGRVLKNLEKDTGQYDDVANIFWATGACFLVRAEVFREVSGFDSDFFAHFEEIDFCWRLRSRNYEIACVPQSVVYHVGGGTLSAESPYKTYLNYRNNLLMLYKNLPAERLKKVMFARYFLDYLSTLHLAITGRFGNALKVFKARRDYKKMRKNYTEIRQKNIRQTTNPEIAEIYPKSMIFQYYFKGEKTYAELTDWQVD